MKKIIGIMTVTSKAKKHGLVLVLGGYIVKLSSTLVVLGPWVASSCESDLGDF